MADDSKKDAGDVYITSHDQRGGITAQNVYLGPQRRDLSKVAKESIDAMIARIEQVRDRQLSVSVVAQDGESADFAAQIRKGLDTAERA